MKNGKRAIAIPVLLLLAYSLLSVNMYSKKDSIDETFFKTHSRVCIYHTNFSDSINEINDGLTIAKGKLHATEKSRYYDFKLIEMQPSTPFLVDVAIPVNRYEHQAIIYSFQDGDNFSFFDIYKNWRSKLVCRKGNARGGKILYEKPFCKTLSSGNKISMLFCNRTCQLIVDEKNITETPVSFDYLKVGYLLTKSYTYHYKFINVFEWTDTLTFDATAYIDKGEIDNKISKSKDKIQSQYAHTSETKIVKSGRSERFELHYDDPTVKTSARTEVTIIPGKRANLRHLEVSFDIYLPDDYVEDEYYEVLFQAHHTPDPEESGQSLNPNIALRTKGDLWCLSINGDSRIKDLSDHKYEYHTFNPLKPFEKNKWTHFDIIIQEGYMPEHNPLTVVLIDGIEVFRTTQPNCYNKQRGSYFKYGIYKSDWMKGHVGTAKKRVVYFDNFVIRQI